MPAGLIEAQCPLSAWKAGCRQLLEGDSQLFNLITSIDSPTTFDMNEVCQHSPNHVKPGANNVGDVINTIFPLSLAAKHQDRADLYSRYLTIHDRAHRWRRGRHAWGTYFERLIRFPKSDNKNQLEIAIEKLNNWPRRNTTGLVFHLSSPATDAPRTRGGPCWHFGEILWRSDNTLDLVVVYRNHDYFNKALGNFVGLGALLNFICINSGKQAGKLVCHSIHAYHDSTIKQLRQLMAEDGH